MKTSLRLFLFGLLTLAGYAGFAQNGKFDVRFTVKSVDCSTMKAVIRVEVKAPDANSTFLMGDGNFRFTYPSTILTNPRIVSEENFSGNAPASQSAYGSQNLNGSTEGPTTGRVVLNNIYGGRPNPTRVGTSYMTVSCIEFTLKQLVTCFDLRWDTTFPATGMSEVIVASGNSFSYTTSDVTPVTHNNLNVCPNQYCSDSYGVRLNLKSFDCVTKKVTMRVQVKSTSPNSGTFLMGDANFRFNYSAAMLTNPQIVLEENYSSNAPASNNGYTPQDLNGSAVSGSAGILSLNVKFSPPGSVTIAKAVSTDWTTVSCIQFDYIGSSTAPCFTIDWRKSTDPVPVTIMNKVAITGANTFSLVTVPTGTIYDNLNICPQQLCSSVATDLSLRKKALATGPVTMNSVVSFSLTLTNKGPNTATNVVVTDTLPAGLQFVSATPNVTVVNGIAQWKVSSLSANTSTSLILQARVMAYGPLFNKAEITKVDQSDPNSIPNNGSYLEDDLGTACVTVPIPMCAGDEFEVSTPSSVTSVQWFRNGIKVGEGRTYTIREPGTYTYLTTVGTCPAEGCCPIIVFEGECCPANLCVPFVIKKTKSR